MAEDWSHLEVKLTVEAYFDMLEAELLGESYNKAAVRRELLPQLDGRSNGSLEFKNCNISAGLITLGLPPIDGYKPRWNYQREMIHSVIEEVLQERVGVFDRVEQVVRQNAVPPLLRDVLSIFDPDLPEREEVYHTLRESRGEARVVKKNYFEQEARNASLGLAGERLVVEYERSRLISLNKEKLADRVEHVSVDQGDGAGFDVRSFDKNGKDHFIEVKTTRFRKESPFFISSNEVDFSRRNAEQYSLYRLYAFERNPRMFVLPGNVEKRVNLSAVSFRGWF